MANNSIALLARTADFTNFSQRKEESKLARLLTQTRIDDVSAKRKASNQKLALDTRKQKVDERNQFIKDQEFFRTQDKDKIDEGVRTALQFLQVQSAEDFEAFKGINPIDSKSLAGVQFGTPEFDQLQRRFQIMVKAAQTPKTAQQPDRTLVEVADPSSPTGTRFVKQSDAVGQPGKPASGTSLTIGSDGQLEFTQGRGVTQDGQINPGKATRNKIEGEILTNRARLDRIDLIAQGFKPKWLEIGTRLGLKFNAIRDKFDAGALNDNELQELNEYTIFRRDAIDNINKFLKEMSGAAITPQEAIRLQASLPNAGTGIFDGDSPAEFQSKINAVIRSLNRAQARLNFAARNGLDFSTLPLESIDAIVAGRRRQLENDGLEDDQVNEVLRKEFGL